MPATAREHPTGPSAANCRARQTTYALPTLDSEQPALSPRTHGLGAVVSLRDHTPPTSVPHAVAAAGHQPTSPPSIHPSHFPPGAPSRVFEASSQQMHQPALLLYCILVNPRWQARHRLTALHHASARAPIVKVRSRRVLGCSAKSSASVCRFGSKGESVRP